MEKDITRRPWLSPSFKSRLLIEMCTGKQPFSLPDWQRFSTYLHASLSSLSLSVNNTVFPYSEPSFLHEQEHTQYALVQCFVSVFVCVHKCKSARRDQGQAGLLV